MIKEECYWGDDAYVPHTQLLEDIHAQVLIVGGGVAGLFTAYHLLNEGVKDIVVLESSYIGSGSTGRSAGMLTCDNETAHWSVLNAHYGQERTKLFFDAQKRALATVARLLRQEDIPCDFAVRDYYVVASGASEHAKVISEFEIVRRFGGLPELLKGAEFKGELATDLYDMGERMEQGITVDPMRFIQGVGRYLSAQGVRIYEHSKVLSVDDDVAHTSAGSVTHDFVVWANGPAASDARLENYVTTIGLTAPVPHEVLTLMALEDRDMYADMIEPSFFYAKVTGEDRLMIGYGDHLVMTSQAEVPLHVPHMDVLTSYLEALRPKEHELSFEYAWSGVYSLCKDPLPLVMIDATHAVLAGAGSQIASIALAEYIAHRYVHGQHPLDALYTTDIRPMSV